MSYRIVYVMPDQSRATAAAGVADLKRARELAAVLMPPVGYLRPEAVEIVPGIGTRAPGAVEVLDWTDTGPTVDVGLVTTGGGIDWLEDDTPTAGPFVGDQMAGGIDPGHGQPLALFDLGAA